MQRVKTGDLVRSTPKRSTAKPAVPHWIGARRSSWLVYLTDARDAAYRKIAELSVKVTPGTSHAGS